METMRYWFLYLTSRRDVSMYIGLGSMLIGAVSMLTGKTPMQFRGLVSRDEEPKLFMRCVVTWFILGLLSVGLSLVGFYLYANRN
jgi:hypothetical protein